jgi:hypothetical protein
VLYAATSLAWGISAVLAVHAAVSESLISRTATLFVLAVSTALSTGTLFVVFVAPLERVYRSGYEAGQRAPVPEVARVTHLRAVRRDA